MRRSMRKRPEAPKEVSHPAIPGLLRSGAVEAHAYAMGNCSIFVAREPMGFSTSVIERPGPYPIRWHMSIAHPRRYPTWDEISEARDKLLPHELVFAQIMPGSWDEYVNLHPNCFHLWEVRDEAG
ncbi:MAG: hypothetical protein KAJ19_25440 [Gammaproteobacteria bacterium]|nr:hypothetical protein [Gammaproteobacteria bacterium]